MGYRGRYTTVRTYTRLLRKAGAAPIRWSVPKVRQVTPSILCCPGHVIDGEQFGLEHVLASCRHLTESGPEPFAARRRHACSCALG